MQTECLGRVARSLRARASSEINDGGETARRGRLSTTGLALCICVTRADSSDGNRLAGRKRTSDRQAVSSETHSSKDVCDLVTARGQSPVVRASYSRPAASANAAARGAVYIDRFA